MTIEEILDYFRDINEAYNDSSKHDDLKMMLERLVKHGYWKIIQKYYMECSVCKTRIDKRDLEWAMDVDADYCPHCGSKMDEEVEDEDQT